MTRDVTVAADRSNSRLEYLSYHVSLRVRIKFRLAVSQSRSPRRYLLFVPNRCQNFIRVDAGQSQQCWHRTLPSSTHRPPQHTLRQVQVAVRLDPRSVTVGVDRKPHTYLSLGSSSPAFPCNALIANRLFVQHAASTLFVLAVVRDSHISAEKMV